MSDLKLPPLPSRRLHDDNVKRINCVNFSELVKIEKNNNLNNIFYTNSNIFIDDMECLKENLDIIKFLIEKRPFNSISCPSVEILKVIGEELKDIEVSLQLSDDYRSIDRSYIDLSNYDVKEIELPLAYLMWNPKLPQNIHYHVTEINNYFSGINSVNSMTKDQLLKFKNIIDSFKDKLQGKDDIYKILFISNYIQNKCQFIYEGSCTQASDGDYVLVNDDDTSKTLKKNVDNPYILISEGFGKCGSYAGATTLLMDNPVLNINTRVVRVPGHFFNVVKVDGKYYYLDNSWSVARNSDRYPESLKARSFDSKYLLFGNDMASEIGHHIPTSYCPNVESSNYPQSIIEEKTAELENTKDYNKPVILTKRISK